MSLSSIMRWACDGMWYLRVTLPALVADLDRRLLLLVGAVHDDLPRQAGDLVHFLVIRDVGDEVLYADRARVLGEDRERVRIPLDEHGALLDLLRRRAP